MTTKLRWFKFYPGDWALDTQGMTPLAKGLYIDMLCMQWAGRRLPADVAELSIMLPAMTERTYRELLQHFVIEDGWLVNGRLEREREDAEGRSENGRAAARRKHDSECARSAAAVPPHSGRSAAAVPPQCHQDTEAEADTETEEEAEGSTARKRAVPTESIKWSPIDGWQGITDRDRADWAIAYPAVGVEQELAKSDQWLRANPEKARKKKWRAFLTRWFDRTQERGGSGGGKVGRSHQRAPHIATDCHPDDYGSWYTTDGRPRNPMIYRTLDGRRRLLSGEYLDEPTTDSRQDQVA